MKTRTAEEWGEIYDLLVEKAGASVQSRAHFIDHCVNEILIEWRFEGLLGMGGKIYQRRHNGTLYISCYPEDQDTGRQRIIDLVNARLATM